jgi:phage-related protein
MTHIYIWDNNLKRYDTCYLLDWNSKNAGKTLADIIYEQQAERIEGKRLKAAAIEARVNLNADIDSIITEAKKAKTSATPKSKSERVSKIRENRAVERTKLRNNNISASSSEVDDLTVPAAQIEEEMSPILRMIKEKAEEKLKND